MSIFKILYAADTRMLYKVYFVHFSFILSSQATTSALLLPSIRSSSSSPFFTPSFHLRRDFLNTFLALSTVLFCHRWMTSSCNSSDVLQRVKDFRRIRTVGIPSVGSVTLPLCRSDDRNVACSSILGFPPIMNWSRGEWVVISGMNRFGAGGGFSLGVWLRYRGEVPPRRSLQRSCSCLNFLVNNPYSSGWKSELMEILVWLAGKAKLIPLEIDWRAIARRISKVCLSRALLGVQEKAEWVLVLSEVLKFCKEAAFSCLTISKGSSVEQSDSSSSSNWLSSSSLTWAPSSHCSLRTSPFHHSDPVNGLLDLRLML